MLCLARIARSREFGRMTKRLGFFTRLLDETSAAERYRLATAQIVQAERNGFDSAWIAQHHFHEAEGGLPAPFVFLTHAAAATSRIRLGTGIVTLPLELPVRVAEDAVVLDLLSNHRLEVGVGPGGNLTAFTAFGRDAKDRHALMNANLDLMRTAWSGGKLPGGDTLYPSSPTLVDRIWQATFSVDGSTPISRRCPGPANRASSPRARSSWSTTARTPTASPRPACRAWSPSARRWVGRRRPARCTT
jgi:alkanesulfonate monooxygenase SsuD/methylene tetrahydromethanopterin reductase-like flavin-dependent oxidoreductase (luciferase family)